jgi:hypothetical protein
MELQEMTFWVHGFHKKSLTHGTHIEAVTSNRSKLKVSYRNLKSVGRFAAFSFRLSVMDVLENPTRCEKVCNSKSKVERYEREASVPLTAEKVPRKDRHRPDRAWV